MHTHSLNTTTAWWLYVALLAATTFLCFSSVAEHGIDDHDIETFRDNARISQDFSYLFSSDREQITGRPAADLGKWLASLVLGDSVAGYHVLVVFIHMLAALLLARLVDVLHEDRRWAFASGLLFLLNITHFQAVHHISAIDYPLALFWGLLGLLAFLRYDATGRRGNLVATYVFFALGTLTHMAAAALGPLCLLWSLQRGRDLRTALRRVVPLGLALVGLVLYGLAIMPTVTSTWTAIDYYGRAEVSPLSSLRLLAWFGGRLLSTAHWVPPLAVYKQQPWEIYFGAATLTTLVGVMWWHWQRMATWVIWIGLGLLPFLFIPEGLILEFLPDGPSRYLYLASAGSSVLIALGLVALGRVVGRWNNALLGAGLVLIFASSYLGIKRVEGFSHYTSGRHNIAANHFEEGAYRLRRAIREGGDTIPLEEAYFRLAIALPYIGEDPLPVLHEGLELFPNSLFLNLTMAIRESESSDEPTRLRGLDRMRRTRQRANGKGDGPLFAYNAASVYYNMANHYLERGETALAIRTYNKALDLVPDKENSRRGLSKAQTLLGVTLQAQGLYERAHRTYHQALALDAQNAAAHVNWGWLYYVETRYDEAIAHYRTALQIEHSSHGLFNLGLAHLALGHHAEARATYEQAIAEFGHAEGVRIGAVDDLMDLTKNKHSALLAQDILDTYWPGHRAER